MPIRRNDLALLSTSFWWAISIAAIFSLARFSPAFLVLKAHDIGIDAAFVPIILVVMYAIYSAAAYPFGILADNINRNLQLGIGSIILVCAHVMLAGASTIWMTALGASLWGLQMGVTQGLLSAAVADAAPERLRGTAFGILDLAVGLATFAANAGAGVLWTFGGPAGSFTAGAALAAVVIYHAAVSVHAEAGSLDVRAAPRRRSNGVRILRFPLRATIVRSGCPLFFDSQKT